MAAANRACSAGPPNGGTHFFPFMRMPKTASFRHMVGMKGRGVNMNVSLSEELANFVKDKVSTGRYGSASEVVREALRLMERAEQQEAEKLELLRHAWREGVESGGAGEVDLMALKGEARARRPHFPNRPNWPISSRS